MIDTHAHLDACAQPADVLVERAREAGVPRIVTVGSGIESCRAAISIADAHVGVFAALGIHPHQAGGDEAERVTELADLVRHPKAVAIGETGLDFFRDYAPHDAQQRLFERHLELASSTGKPVVIHCRAAEEEVQATLAAFAGRVVLHCFSSPPLLKSALERGWYVSFAGNVTFPQAQELRDAAARVPAERLLAETDCPYLAPQPRRGRPNEPANVVHTLATLAAVRGVDRVELEAQIEANASRAFRLP